MECIMIQEDESSLLWRSSNAESSLLNLRHGCRRRWSWAMDGEWPVPALERV